jgi:hypothetical protein
VADTQKKDFDSLTGMAGCVTVCRELYVGSVGAKCYLMYLASNVNNDSCTFYKSTLEASIDTGLDEHTIRDLNEKWIKAGFLKVTEHPWWTKQANDYKLILSVLRQFLKAQLKEGVKDVAMQARKNKSNERTQRYRLKKKAKQA